jgi:hypothetical protein
LVFVHGVYYKIIKLQGFKSCVLLSSSSKKRRRIENLSVRPLVHLASGQEVRVRNSEEEEIVLFATTSGQTL